MNLETLILPMKTEDNAFRAGISRATQLVGALVSAIGNTVTEGVKLASDLSETMSKVNVVFGTSATKINAWGATAAKSLGMSKNTALAAAATFGNLFRAMNMTEDVSADMSMSLVNLAGDLASFNNMDPTVVLDKLRAGLSGETEPLKSLGVNLNQVIIQEKAREMGLWDGVGAMDAATKAQASYALIMEQTNLAQGDFARTSEGLANQQRILAAKWEDLKTVLGTAFLPMVTAAVSKFNEFLDILAGPGSFSSKIGEIASQIDEFVGGILQSMADAINEWASGDGPQQFSDMLVSWIDKIGTGEGIDSKMATAALNLAEALGRAFMALDWAQIDQAMDNLDARVLAKFDEMDAAILAQFDAWDAQLVAAYGKLGTNIVARLNQLDVNAQSTFNRMLAGMGNSVNSGLTSIDSRFASWSVGVGATVTAWGSRLISTITLTMNQMNNNIGAKVAAITEIFTSRFGSIPRKAAEAFNAGKQALIGVVQTVVAEINKVLSKIITSFRLSFGGVSWGNAPSTGTSSSTSTGSTSGNCFVAGTMILMHDGSTKPIDDVKVGDTVLSYYEGAFIQTRVVEVFKHGPEEASSLVIINDEITSTPEHLFYSDGRWMEAGTLVVGSPILYDGKRARVSTVKVVEGKVDTFNLHTDHISHNYVANGFLVHNAKGRASGGPVIKGLQYPVAEYSRFFSRPEMFTPGQSGRIDTMPTNQLQVVHIANWYEFDYPRLASEMVKAENNR